MRVRALAALATTFALAGCGGTSAVSSSTPRPVAPTSDARTSAAPPATSAAASPTSAPLPTCGAAPVTDGPSKGLIGATLTGPTSAPAGSVLDLVVHLRSLDGRSHTLQSGIPSVLVLQGGRLVGEYQGGVAAIGIAATVTGTRPGTMKASVLLAGCPKLPLIDSAPDLARKPLPAGSYQLVADLPDVSGKPYGRLVSAPMPLQVTAYPSTLPTCGDVPASTGPSSGTIGAELVAPATAAAGSTVHVQVQLRSYRGKAEPFESGLPVEVLIVKDGLVVGRSDGPIAGVGIEVTVPASGTTPLIPSAAPANINSAVTLSGCPQGGDSSPPSPSPRKALPPGTYQLVADFEDDNSGGAPGVLVAEPATIKVTAG